MSLPIVSEDFVQYVWQFSLFETQHLQLASGDRVQIVSPGTKNTSDGPDFFNAKIYIGETLWVGNVEIHLSNKDWQQHKHELDERYNNIILHVVYVDENESIQTANGRHVPTLSIGEKIYKNTLHQYKTLSSVKPAFIPCENLFTQLDTFTIKQYTEALLIQRLERKISEIEADLHYTQGDIDAAFLMSLFKYFGAPVNKEPFHLLAKSFTIHQLIKQNTNVVQLEAMLFGLADLLQNQDAYANKLANEFEYLRKLYKWQMHCKRSQWHFSGVRPPNFPTVRLAQLAALLHKEVRLFSKIMETTTLKELMKLLDVRPSDYWSTHFNFGIESAANTKKITTSFKEKLLINVVVPFLFFYGKYKSEEHYVDRALHLLEEMKAESNGIILGFKNLAYKSENAFDSQACIELYNEYCSKKACLQCRLAFTFLKQKNA